MLEINQAGLSWITILKKKEAFHRAYDGFDVDKVAAYGEAETARLLGDASIIRNRLKVKAAIENARRIQGLRGEYRILHRLAGRNTIRSAWRSGPNFLNKTFVFTGGEIVKEFLVSSGYLPGAHEKVCPVYRKIAKLHPAWSPVILEEVRASARREKIPR